MTRYSDENMKLYRSVPNGLHAGSTASIPVTLLELERRASQIQQEYAAKLAERKDAVSRLIAKLERTPA